MEDIMKKNKMWMLGVILSLCSGMVVGCGNEAQETTKANEVQEVEENTDTKQDKISVVCTIFPQYDWVKELIGAQSENYDLTVLLDNGVDLHSYQPTAEDIAKIADCDVFIYVGGESDGWVEDALKEATNKNMQVINLLDVLGEAVKEEEIVEGMEHGHHHEHEEGEHEHEEDEHEEGEHEHEEAHEEHHHEHEEGEVEYDEHVWLSLKNANVLVENIEEALEKVDSQNTDIYKSNYENYRAQLEELDKQYESLAASAKTNTVLFGDRFPFRYMVDDYNLDYYAAFAGCSAETEASFETIAFLSEKTNELKLPTVLVIENSDQKIAKAIVENTASKDQKILEMDSMQSVTSKEMEEGYTYLDAMKENLEVLKVALN